ncbi:phosphate ion transporter [Aureococcus anophagefferens]|uniref:Phosphate ion transporter n=1 Tax=Aureococcus anophagefferens TaxID=44056 RepID=A0ABR1G9W5_AURAN
MLVVPCLMMAVKFLKLDFAPYVEQLRIGFGCACALTLGVHFLVKSIAAAGKADATEIAVTTTNPMKPGEKETKTWTICNYDQAEALKKVKSGLVACAW